jgi:hypothetical protein
VVLTAAPNDGLSVIRNLAMSNALGGNRQSVPLRVSHRPRQTQKCFASSAAVRSLAANIRALQESPDVFDLRVHVSGPRARMFSLSQPQLFIAVEKL